MCYRETQKAISDHRSLSNGQILEISRPNKYIHDYRSTLETHFSVLFLLYDLIAVKEPVM